MRGRKGNLPHSGCDEAIAEVAEEKTAGALTVGPKGK